MKPIEELLVNIDYQIIQGSLKDLFIADIAYDSRKIQKNSLFVCIKGFVTDGHQYIESAILQNVAAIIIQTDQMNDSIEAIALLHPEILFLAMENTRIALSRISFNFYHRPSSDLKLFGITGTKGKTTASYILWHILQQTGAKNGLIGTVANIVDQISYPTTHTTPESLELQKLFAQMNDSHHNNVVMEVSSQGLSLHRVEDCFFEVAGFSNFFLDHIGYGEHANMEEYLQAKLKIFTQAKKAIINLDNHAALDIFAFLNQHNFPPQQVWVFSLEDISKQANFFENPAFFGYVREDNLFRAESIKPGKREDKVGTYFTLKSPWYQGEFFLSLAGIFNVSNALLAIGMAGSCHISEAHVRKGLENVYVPGRFEMVNHSGDFSVLVDYAHNAASLETLLHTLRPYCKGRLIVVFGCGGNRSKTRRYEMGEVAGKFSDYTIITSDNPRLENPEDIIRDIQEGMDLTQGAYGIEIDRKKAIFQALQMAQSQDYIVIAGKGHEKYQIIGEKTLPFDDMTVAKEWFLENQK